MADSTQEQIYIDCITKQLEEVDLLSAIYCAPGEMHIFDPSVISDFNDFLKQPNAAISTLKANLDYMITIPVLNGKSAAKVEIRIELPHLYPVLENAIVVIHSVLLGKPKEIYFKHEIEKFIAEQNNHNDTYVFQVISWIQEHIEQLIMRDAKEFEIAATAEIKTVDEFVEFERLWIYSHHIKSKTKRQEILKEARNLELSGFSRPGKPGIICVEGLRINTQSFWRIIKSMRWQKITICKEEVARKPLSKIDDMRRFESFKEQLFCDDLENEEGIMNMGLFVKYLELHNSGYMKKELFGF